MKYILPTVCTVITLAFGIALLWAKWRLARRAMRVCPRGHRWPAPVTADGWTTAVEFPSPRCPKCGAFCVRTIVPPWRRP